MQWAKQTEPQIMMVFRGKKCRHHYWVLSFRLEARGLDSSKCRLNAPTTLWRARLNAPTTLWHAPVPGIPIHNLGAFITWGQL